MSGMRTNTAPTDENWFPPTKFPSEAGEYLLKLVEEGSEGKSTQWKRCNFMNGEWHKIPSGWKMIGWRHVGTKFNEVRNG